MNVPYHLAVRVPSSSACHALTHFPLCGSLVSQSRAPSLALPSLASDDDVIVLTASMPGPTGKAVSYFPMSDEIGGGEDAWRSCLRPSRCTEVANVEVVCSGVGPFSDLLSLDPTLRDDSPGYLGLPEARQAVPPVHLVSSA
jgi:hypothetical protein